VLLIEAVHLVLHHLLLLMQEVNCLVDMWAHHCRLVHMLLLKLKLVQFLKLLVLLSQDQVVLKDLTVLLGSQRHLAGVHDTLPVLHLLAFWVETYFLTNELVLLLKLVWVEIIGIILLLRNKLLAILI
jgi:hypothetical protein